jgi:hypothetical protein
MSGKTPTTFANSSSSLESLLFSYKPSVYPSRCFRSSFTIVTDFCPVASTLQSFSQLVSLFQPPNPAIPPLVISQLACRTISNTYAPAVRSTTYTPENILKLDIGRGKGIPALKPVLAQPASTDPSFLCPLWLSPTRHSCSSDSALERQIFAVQACQIQSLFYFTVQAEKQTGLSHAQEVIHPLDGRVYA